MSNVAEDKQVGQNRDAESERLATESYLTGIVERVLAKQTSQPQKWVSGYGVTSTLEQDADLLARTAHVRTPGEKIMQFFARTGLGLHQLRNMTKDEIKRFVDVTTANPQPLRGPRTR